MTIDWNLEEKKKKKKRAQNVGELAFYIGVGKRNLPIYFV